MNSWHYSKFYFHSDKLVTALELSNKFFYLIYKQEHIKLFCIAVVVSVVSLLKFSQITWYGCSNIVVNLHKFGNQTCK